MRGIAVKSLGAAVSLMLFGASRAPAGEITWTFQQIETAPARAQHVAVGFGVGMAMPIVAYEGSANVSGGSQMVAAGLKPVGWKRWGIGPLDPNTSNKSFVQAAAGQDGRVGFVWHSGTTLCLAQYTGQTWQTSSLATSTNIASGIYSPDIAYMSGNRPVVAYRTSTGNSMRAATYDDGRWDIDTPTTTGGSPIGGMYVRVAVDSQDRVGLAYRLGSNLSFAMRDPSNGKWSTSVVVPSTPATNFSLAYGENDLPAITYLGGSTLSFAWFSPVTGVWDTETIATGVQSPRANLAFDSQGHPAVAYVSAGSLHYRINEGAGWVDTIVPTSPVSNTDVALTFDRNDLPVLSYYSGTALTLAYDPVVTPEPASLLLVATGVMGLLTRRRRSEPRA